jgi:hypothetical protein
MVFRIPRIVIPFVLASAFTGAVQAQTGRLHFGPHVAYQFDFEKLGIGAQFSAPLARNLEFYPSLDYFFVDNGSFWALNADLKYRFSRPSVEWLYVGTGLNIARSGSGSVHDTRAGLNLIGGVESLTGRVHPFGEFRLTVGDGSTAQVAAGLNFTLNSR